jgi:DNA invertase Pin-like site-specific DNA recombinase
METYFAYIRVSTAKQGERGVSLQEQKSAILGYSTRNNLHISQWFEERETAAKRGRPVFTQMLRLLKRGQTKGVIIHKIDRSARNLKDWADLGELIDSGHEIHFVNESLDMTSRGGRLSADIQAVVAADYIRNLREETRKGFYGRLKQGLYPLPAPVGYIDKGSGQPKIPNPETAHLIRKIFELYTTSTYSIVALTKEANRLGLRTKPGKLMTKTSIHRILTNPFYMGLVRIKATKELFQGCHEPIISKSLFDRTQAVLTGKCVRGTQTHDYLFRRLLTCQLCTYSLVGERQKGHIYYRCHTKGCPTTAIREEIAESKISRLLEPLKFSKDEQAYLDMRLSSCKKQWKSHQAKTLTQLRIDLAKTQEKLMKLTDAYLESRLDRAVLDMRHNQLILEMKDIEEKIRLIEAGKWDLTSEVEKFLELCKTAYSQYEYGFLEEKREIIKTITSNRLVCRKNLDFTLSFPFQQIAERQKRTHGGPYQDIPRTCEDLFIFLWDFFKKAD